MWAMIIASLLESGKVVDGRALPVLLQLAYV